jgi:chromosome segregation ATPase
MPMPRDTVISSVAAPPLKEQAMTDDFSDLRHRQDRLEGRVAQLESKVELEAGLRADMDKELGTISVKLNAHQQSLNALQEVQGDHTRQLARIEEGLGTVKEGLGAVKEDVATVRGDLVMVKTGVHAILDLLDANLAKKSLTGRLAGRFTKRRDDGGNG